MLAGKFNPFITPAGMENLPTVLIQHGAKDPAAIRIIVDNQNSLHARTVFLSAASDSIEFGRPARLAGQCFRVRVFIRWGGRLF